MAATYYRTRNLRAILDAGGMRYDWFAKRLGMHPGHLTNVMTGKATLSEARAKAAAEVLRLPLFVFCESAHASTLDADDAESVDDAALASVAD